MARAEDPIEDEPIEGISEEDFFEESAPRESRDPLQDDYPLGDEQTEAAAPLPQELPPAYAFVKETLYNTRIPKEVSSWFWDIDNVDIRLGNLTPDDETDITYGHIASKLAKFLTLRRQKGAVSWEDFEKIVQFDTVVPAIISRGRKGFERYAEIAQLSISLSGAGMVSATQGEQNKGKISSLWDSFQKLLE